MTYASHLSFIKTIAAQSPNQLLFKLPILEPSEPNSGGHTILGWKDITYSQFLSDVERLAKYWLNVLGYADGHGSTIGLWMAGMTYTDVVHLFSLMTAGFVPHTLDLNFQVFTIIALDSDELADKALDDMPLPSDRQDKAGNDIIMMHHTSGSTSGRPKIVRLTQSWFSAALVQMKNAGCIVLTPWVDFTPEELLQIIKECKINTIHQFSALLNRTLREATTNLELELALKSLEFIGHTGSSIGKEESKWAIEHEIPLRDLFGSTETGVLMASLTNDTILYPIKLPGIVYEFWPVDATRVGLTSSGLFELVIPRVSLDCPFFCDPKEGHHRTKDLFEEVHPGAYKYRGRLDDMIKMENASICDTRYIETQVSDSCKDLISCCVVVGSNRPSPVLLVEPLSDDIDRTKLKEKIGTKVQLINKNSYSHERIDPSHILIVQRGGLPRTSAGRKPFSRFEGSKE
ncbi:hypothetical protein Clacol_007958 [Clathrus columnatus]|uniref:AMP-dependent synthetase/ligase domain-containing protein n=1 Tax=Clathrus columnatus TaxID=1419009 RepID=A0AAV5AIW8_9AGAM|nr:hypothetical protein Clacol_007958 [Clathrus columnatus]